MQDGQGSTSTLTVCTWESELFYHAILRRVWFFFLLEGKFLWWKLSVFSPSRKKISCMILLFFSFPNCIYKYIHTILITENPSFHVHNRKAHAFCNCNPSWFGYGLWNMFDCRADRLHWGYRILEILMRIWNWRVTFWSNSHLMEEKKLLRQMILHKMVIGWWRKKEFSISEEEKKN